MIVRSVLKINVSQFNSLRLLRQLRKLALSAHMGAQGQNMGAQGQNMGAQGQNMGAQGQIWPFAPMKSWALRANGRSGPTCVTCAT